MAGDLSWEDIVTGCDPTAVAGETQRVRARPRSFDTISSAGWTSSVATDRGIRSNAELVLGLASAAAKPAAKILLRSNGVVIEQFFDAIYCTLTRVAEIMRDHPVVKTLELVCRQVQEAKFERWN